jgi:hypothetical protein
MASIVLNTVPLPHPAPPPQERQPGVGIQWFFGLFDLDVTDATLLGNPIKPRVPESIFAVRTFQYQAITANCEEQQQQRNQKVFTYLNDTHHQWETNQKPQGYR